MRKIKRALGFDARWIQFVTKVHPKSDPATELHTAFQLGYLAGKETQKQRDLREIDQAFCNLPYSFGEQTIAARQECITAIWKAVSSTEVVDRYIKFISGLEEQASCAK